MLIFTTAQLNSKDDVHLQQGLLEDLDRFRSQRREKKKGITKSSLHGVYFAGETHGIRLNGEKECMFDKPPGREIWQLWLQLNFFQSVGLVYTSDCKHFCYMNSYSYT